MDPVDEAAIWLESKKSPSCAQAARKFKVNYHTLWRRWHRKTHSRADATSLHKKLLTTAQEHKLIDYINKLSDRGMPPTHQILENLVVEIVGHGIGDNWTYRFVDRYKNIIKSIYLRPLDNARKVADNTAHFTHFYQMIGYFLFNLSFYTSS
jgi:hypothetical protein